MLTDCRWSKLNQTVERLRKRNLRFDGKIEPILEVTVHRKDKVGLDTLALWRNPVTLLHIVAARSIQNRNARLLRLHI